MPLDDILVVYIDTYFLLSRKSKKFQKFSHPIYSSTIWCYPWCWKFPSRFHIYIILPISHVVGIRYILFIIFTLIILMSCEKFFYFSFLLITLMFSYEIFFTLIYLTTFKKKKFFPSLRNRGAHHLPTSRTS